MTFRTVKVNNRTSNLKKITVFEFSSSEGLFACVEQLYGSRYTRYIKSDLYTLNGKYRLLLTADTSEFTLLKHYYHLTDRLMLSLTDIAFTKEYFKLITAENAVNRIGKAVIKSL